MEPVPPPPEPQSTLDAIRRRLATVVGRADYRPPYGHEAAAFAAVADALLILLPTTPPPGKHVVDDVPPVLGQDGHDDDVWEWRDKCVVWWEPEPVEWSDGPRPVGLLTGPGREWLTIADARTLAAHLLSAADRAEKVEPPRDEQGRTPRERVAAGLPAYDLTDAQAADVAVASGWIEDTPEARAAYLAGQADQ